MREPHLVPLLTDEQFRNIKMVFAIRNGTCKCMGRKKMGRDPSRLNSVRNVYGKLSLCKMAAARRGTIWGHLFPLCSCQPWTTHTPDLHCGEGWRHSVPHM